MNERIKELWEEAAKTTQGDSWDEQTQFMERFAELIVRECADVAKETRWAVPPSQEQIARRIQQHFGVEE